jgi:uncharacterized protein YceK
MKKFILILTLVFLISGVLSGCNAVTRNYGGTQNIKLEQGQKLVNLTWKDSDLWILTRDMRPDETPEKFKFQEDSNLGVFEGTINIIESN